MDDFLQAASAERPPSYEMLSEVCAHGVLVHDQLFHACKAHEVLISSETIHLVGIDKVSSEFAFPGQRAQAQLHVGLIFYAIELFDLFDAVVVFGEQRSALLRAFPVFGRRTAPRSRREGYQGLLGHRVQAVRYYRVSFGGQGSEP